MPAETVDQIIFRKKADRLNPVEFELGFGIIKPGRFGVAIPLQFHTGMAEGCAEAFEPFLAPDVAEQSAGTFLDKSRFRGEGFAQDVPRFDQRRQNVKAAAKLILV